MKALGAAGMSKSQGLSLCAEIDTRVNAFLNLPLEHRWPYLQFDATCLTVCDAGEVAGPAVIIAVMVNEDGKREVLGVATGPSEADELHPVSLDTHSSEERPERSCAA